MPNSQDNASVVSKSLIGIETTTGTAVTTKDYNGLSYELQGESEGEFLRAEGNKHPNIFVPGKESSTAELMIQPDFQSIVVPLSGIVKPTTSTSGSKVTRTFDPSAKDMDAYNTYTLEKGTKRRARRSVGHTLYEFGMDITIDKVSFSGKTFGRKVEENVPLSVSELQTVTISGNPTGGTVTLTFAGQSTSALAYNASASAVQTALQALSSIGSGNVLVTNSGTWPSSPMKVQFTGLLGQSNQPLITTSHALTGGSSPSIAVVETTPGALPTEVEALAMNARNVDLFMDDTDSAIGTTQLDRGFALSWKASNLRQPLYTSDSRTNGYATEIDAVPTHAIEVSVGADNFGMALIDTYRAGQTKFIRAKITGPSIAGGGNYTYTFDAAIKLGKTANTYSEQGLLVAAKFPAEIVYSATYGRGYRVVVENTLVTM